MLNLTSKTGIFLTFCVLCAGMNSVCADAIPYAPHPERQLGSIENQQATFLVTEALHLISMSVESAGELQREALLEQIKQQPDIVQLLGMKEMSLEQRFMPLQGALNTWKNSYPSTSAPVGSYAAVEFEPRELRRLAHGLIRFAYDLSGVTRPNTAKAIVEDTVLGAHGMYQSDRIRTLRKTLADACSQRKTVLDDDPAAPKLFKWVRWGLRYLPGSEVINAIAEGQLGKRKTCETLVADVIDIVGPHQSPLRSTPTQTGQLEGMSLYLARTFYAGNDPENNLMLKQLRKLSTVSGLDSAMGEAQAVSIFLDGPVSNRALVRLMALPSHNHSLELYLQKAAIQLIEDPDKATRVAAETFTGLNHFYALLNDHRLARKSSPASDRLATAARPYHYWGGALVACELAARGYEPWVSALVSGMLGKVYESWTGSNGEGLSDKAEDIQLHIQGALDWVNRC